MFGSKKTTLGAATDALTLDALKSVAGGTGETTQRRDPTDGVAAAVNADDLAAHPQDGAPADGQHGAAPDAPQDGQQDTAQLAV